MGYRSVVEAVFYTRKEEEYPLLKLYVDENIPKFWKEEDEKYLKPIKARNTWGYHFITDNVKWYESYPEIQEYSNFVERFEEFAESRNWAYEFVRLGEEMDDIEEHRSTHADYILSVSREIQLLP
jgi:hypothetical protein